MLATTTVFLEKSGFTVERAGRGEDVLPLLGASQAFDAIVSDYAMPGLNGADLIADARNVQPGLKGLLITGYAAEKHAATLPTDVPVLQKPFKRAELVEALYRILRVDRDTVEGMTADESVPF